MILLQLVKMSGAAKIVVSEPNEVRRQKALELGADLCINPLEEGYYEKYTEFMGEGAEVVIECAGNRAAVEGAFKFAKKGAMILLFSVPSVGATYDLPLMDVFKKELTKLKELLGQDASEANQCSDSHEAESPASALTHLDRVLGNQGAS